MKRILILIFISVGFTLAQGCGPKILMEEKSITYQSNKLIPEKILEETKEALSYFPQLKDVPIEFRFKENIKKSFMQAQPQVSDFFRKKNKRGYTIYISRKVTIEGKDFTVDEVPYDVLVGWLGHELGHVIDYRERSAMGLVFFGLRYLSSDKHIKEAERMADTYAVNQGMGEFIIKTKEFILDHSHLSEKYKSRIKRLYLSPEEIVSLVNEFEEDAGKEKGGG